MSSVQTYLLERSFRLLGHRQFSTCFEQLPDEKSNLIMMDERGDTLNDFEVRCSDVL